MRNEKAAVDQTAASGAARDLAHDDYTLAFIFQSRTDEQLESDIVQSAWVLRADDAGLFDLNEIGRLAYQLEHEQASKALARRRLAKLSFPKPTFGITRDYLRDLKERVNIVDVITDLGTPMRRAGRSYVGICPFHDDREPSLVAWPEDGGWKCFGCGIGGDIITFTQAFARLGFKDAVYAIAARYGVPMPPDPDHEQAKRSGLRRRAVNHARA